VRGHILGRVRLERAVHLSRGVAPRALKDLYARPDDRVEETVDGFVVDVVRPDELVEIQTGSFASAARKLRRLVEDRRLALVHPVAASGGSSGSTPDGMMTDRRRSPKRGQRLDLFDQLVAFPELVAHPISGSSW